MPTPSQNILWPAQTPVPHSSSPRLAKRRRTLNPPNGGSTSKMARQIVTDKDAVAQAKTNCEVNSGNEVVSCFPTSDTVIPQHQWATFVWNSNLPDFTQTDRVDIYLFHGDSQEQILHFQNIVNPKGQAGSITAQVNDSWWGNRATNWNGHNISYPFFWIMSRSDHSLDDGTQQPQATFQAVQTTFADFVIASMASTSSVASVSATATFAAASTTGSSLSLRSSGTSGVNPTGGVQTGASSSGFPHWAIAVIVVLGFLAIATTCVLAFFIIRRMRRRAALESNRNSMGSSSPMMANTGTSAAAPLLAGAAIPGRHASTATSHGGAAPSVVSPDGASTISRAGSAGDPGPFSGADAAIMADAFRKALRKPDFAGRPVEEGESPEHDEGGAEANEDELLRGELADEGRDIRSVGSSRGVHVETLSDSGDTAHENPH
ncbi:hypothetical protein DFH08DRAFT_680431 [Mycena albidolilacea]|uniref:Uncharacterized protein n=1 Tax=Mycena albidolilacea TaxID=1033008 RepID=A0AAD7ARG5_9AGAR|nr:hypothetical protein DFH08DRAFT_680431 [Mycena albidolilacea]